MPDVLDIQTQFVVISIISKFFICRLIHYNDDISTEAFHILYIYDKRVEIVLYVYGSCLINANDC